MKHTFKEPLTELGTKFTRHFEEKMLIWDTIKPHEYDEYSEMDMTAHINMVTNSSALDLHTEVNRQTGSFEPVNQCYFDYSDLPIQHVIITGPTKIVIDKFWNWSDKHNGNYKEKSCHGVCVKNRYEEHEIIPQCNV